MSIDPTEIKKRNGVNFVIWAFWAGKAMNKTRQLSFDMMRSHVGVPVILVDLENLDQLILPEYPLHPAFQYLSVVHKSDYLRAYLAHHWGGGWHDIKATEVSFEKAWDEFRDESVYLVGRKESQKGAARVFDKDNNWMPDKWEDLVITSAYVVRANNPFTKELLQQMDKVLDENSDLLRRYPAKHPRERKLESKNMLQEIFNRVKNLYAGRTHHYPLPWTYIGNAFQPLVYKYREHVRQTLPSDLQRWAGVKHR
ncbi:capsular polysaccharide synthesis protein [Algoriphagus sp. NG3]|uniref:capsular polysaccharide synthesis protein n=1 Tax=Algoriphagus sp. NG3 TaxID=3097546 RepID=UPI002A7F43F2|nr:capsular polysaccharide synthesis protein [Algoriphagus sp. NG3]WPR75444.1 capsular polysaccharide synthesis protein [Algoriphagus sp. NG3]